MTPSALAQVDLITDEIVLVHREGQLVAYGEYAWVKNYADVCRVDAHQPPHGGPVLYVLHVVITLPEPRLVWRLKRQFPSARYWVWRDAATWTLHSPKGVPHDFYA